MYIFINSLKNVIRNIGRNILLAIILLAVIVGCLTALIIHTTSKGLIEDYMALFGAKVYINPNSSKVSVMSGRQSEQIIPLPEVYAALADSDCLMGADLSCQVPSVSDTLLGLGELSGGTAVPIAPNGGAFTKFPTMNVKGYTNPEQLDDFIEGYRGLIEGRFPVKDNECIVSEDFKQLNNLHLGEIIELAQGMVEHNPLSLEVVGFYFDLTQNQFGSAVDAPAAINVRNDIITNYHTAFDFAKSDPRVDTAAYYLKSPELLYVFEAEARAAGLSYDYLVTIDESAYLRVVEPIKGMGSITLTFMIILLTLGVLIVAILAAVAIRERKFEIGVVRAMGMKKHQVALGLVFESLIITIICLAVAIGIVLIITQPISDMLLVKQLSINEPQDTSTGTSMMYAGMQTSLTAQPPDEMQVVINMQAVVMISLVCLLLVFISSLVGIAQITKYEPIKILTERN
ncbi:MAG: ABC transporter permease [Oscillospiraceae bacterium]|nr:ABC transporter permease [Oscillospiraceae bacterium]